MDSISSVVRKTVGDAKDDFGYFPSLEVGGGGRDVASLLPRGDMVSLEGEKHEML